MLAEQVPFSPRAASHPCRAPLEASTRDHWSERVLHHVDRMFSPRHTYQVVAVQGKSRVQIQVEQRAAVVCRELVAAVENLLQSVGDACGFSDLVSNRLDAVFIFNTDGDDLWRVLPALDNDKQLVAKGGDDVLPTVCRCGVCVCVSSVLLHLGGAYPCCGGCFGTAGV